jgi:hypothetical protein
MKIDDPDKPGVIRIDVPYNPSCLLIRRRWVRIPSWLEADPALHREAVYIEADHFFHQR